MCIICRLVKLKYSRFFPFVDSSSSRLHASLTFLRGGKTLPFLPQSWRIDKWNCYGHGVARTIMWQLKRFVHQSCRFVYILMIHYPGFSTYNDHDIGLRFIRCLIWWTGVRLLSLIVLLISILVCIGNEKGLNVLLSQFDLFYVALFPIPRPELGHWLTVTVFVTRRNLSNCIKLQLWNFCKVKRPMQSCMVFVASQCTSAFSSPQSLHFFGHLWIIRSSSDCHQIL